jgi:hypothetical protein
MTVEEQLRITTPIQNLYRYTRGDYQVGDVTIPKGSRVLLSFGAANRDPLAFDDPDEYRTDRNPPHARGIRLRRAHVPRGAVGADGSAGGAAGVGEPSVVHRGHWHDDMVHPQFTAGANTPASSPHRGLTNHLAAA